MTNNPLESIPPHDVESEATVIGCLFSPRVAKLILPRLEEADFYYPQHRQIFAAMHHLLLSIGAIDEKLVCDELALRHKGDWYDPVAFCAAKNTPAVESHVQVLKDRRAERDVQIIAQKVLQSIALKQGEQTIADAQALFATLAAPTRSMALQPASTPRQLLEFNTENDADCLLGTRWLCRGGSMMLNGQTGIGKSSFIMQAAITWALKQPFFGIIPHYAHKTLIIQNENDMGDMSEMFKGVIKGLDVAHRMDEIDERIRIVEEWERTGAQFLHAVEQLVLEHKPDLCWIDPFLAYIGGDAKSQEVCAAFFRQGLRPIQKRTGVTFCVVNHTPKPSRDPKARNGFRGGDYAYSGYGSADIAGYARESLTIQEVEDGLYVLLGGKRRERCGLLHPKYMRHADPSQGICWYDAMPAADSCISAQFEDVLAQITEPMKSPAVVKIIMKVFGVKSQRAYSHLADLKKAGRLTLHPGLRMYSTNQTPTIYPEP